MDDERITLPDYRRAPAIFGPRVREPQETIQIRRRVEAVESTTVDLSALTLSLTRPAIHGAPASGPASGNVRVWFTFGTWNQRLPGNTVWYLDVAASADRYFFAKATISTFADRLTLIEWWLVSGAAEDSEVTSAWGAAGELPGTLVLMLGTYNSTTGKVASTGKGSIYTRDHLSNVTTDAGTTTFTRNIDFVRH
jgi:hypothetical protein